MFLLILSVHHFSVDFNPGLPSFLDWALLSLLSRELAPVLEDPAEVCLAVIGEEQGSHGIE